MIGAPHCSPRGSESCARDPGVVDARARAAASRSAPHAGHVGCLQGYFPTADIASVYIALGEAAAAQPFLTDASDFLKRYESGGNVWHAAQYQRARIAAMLGQFGASFRSARQSR